LNQQAVDQLAGKLFELLLTSETSEAETVAALAIAVTMRLAYGADSIEEVLHKLQKLHPIFMDYARVNAASFEAARKAAANANK
jgi:hypothetical protein